MKARYAEWAKLTPAPAIHQGPPVRIRDLPGATELERNLLLRYSGRGNLPFGLDEMMDDFSKATFGILLSDTEFVFPDDFQSLLPWERWDIENQRDVHDEQYATLTMDDFQAAEFLLGEGLDFYDERKNPLRCLRHLKRQAEAAAKGSLGKMPDRAVVGLERWASTLEADAKAHMAKKHR
ncbi:hypothetical protein [Mesorhizobium sp. M4B.F.Ca.ET.017.02.2.1]|nr:hypothetical protein [Mesorhizobium sp. M4B.F.Ca.ET.017.02.2.1]RVD21139.1 hypothetical protein EN738_19815 [Mesorhizobium sp. M4B.F.Ca.ET.017.02.2.1]